MELVFFLLLATISRALRLWRKSWRLPRSRGRCLAENAYEFWENHQNFKSMSLKLKRPPNLACPREGRAACWARAGLGDRPWGRRSCSGWSGASLRTPADPRRSRAPPADCSNHFPFSTLVCNYFRDSRRDSDTRAESGGDNISPPAAGTLFILPKRSLLLCIRWDTWYGGALKKRHTRSETCLVGE